MPLDRIKAKTGNAPIRKLGHTSVDRFGRNPDKRAQNRTPREESAK